MVFSPAITGSNQQPQGSPGQASRTCHFWWQRRRQFGSHQWMGCHESSWKVAKWWHQDSTNLTRKIRCQMHWLGLPQERCRPLCQPGLPSCIWTHPGSSQLRAAQALRLSLTCAAWALAWSTRTKQCRSLPILDSTVHPTEGSQA